MTLRKHFAPLCAVLLALAACSEEIDTSARYVFRDHTVASYLEQHPATYSEYVALTKQVPMSKKSATTVYQLLTARGNYTCFAITNQAIQAYLDSLVSRGLIAEPRWEAFTDSAKLDSIRQVIVKNSIIDGGDMESQRYGIALFPQESNSEFTLPNIHDHRLTVRWGDDPDSVYINGDCDIDLRNRDIPVMNGVVHQVHRVIAPEDRTAARFFQDILDRQEEGFLLFARCVQACGLLDTLSAVRDEVYERLYQTGQIPDFPKYMTKGFSDKSGTESSDALSPQHRKYGFTLFAETDDYWISQGISPTAPDALEQLVAWIADKRQIVSDRDYTQGQDYASPRNILYQWVTYHILPMRLPANKLVHHCNEVGYSVTNPSRFSIPVMEWYATMGERRLLKLYESRVSGGVCLNRFPIRDNGRKGTGYELSCDPDKVGCLVMRDHPLATVNNVSNACIYPIDQPLAYNDETRNNLAKERIRFDGMALFPEAATNGIRRADSQEDQYQHVYIPVDRIYRYFDGMRIMSDDTHFIYFNGYRINWANYSQDEMKAIGHFDIMFTLPPVPKRGTYELRYKTLATGARGVVQIYFGSDPENLPVAGIPIDMTKGIVDSFGEGGINIADTGDEAIDSEIDHKLRNHGLMKSARHEVHEGNSTWTARDDMRCTRHIIARQTLDPDKTYYVRFKSVLDSDKKELYMDYMEWCPKEIYDNPETPEDVW